MTDKTRLWQLPRRMSVLRRRDFRLLFLANAVSVIGDYVAPVALAFAVLATTGSVTALGLVIAVQTLSGALTLLGAGVLADRVPRFRLMIIANVIQAASQAALAATLLAGVANLGPFLVVQVTLGAGRAMFRPALVGALPATVSTEEIQPANSLLSMAGSSATIAGPLLGGLVIAIASPGAALLFDAVTFAVSAIFLSRIKLTVATQPPAEKPRFVDDLRVGFREIRRLPWVSESIAVFSVFQFAGLSSLLVAGPLIARLSYGGAVGWSVLLSALGVGSLAGDLIALRIRPRRPLVAVFGSVPIVGIALVLLSVPTPIALTAVGMLAAGAVFSCGDTVWLSTLQREVPPNLLSRVSAIDWLGSTVLYPLGLAAVGPIIGLIGIRLTLLGSASLVLVACAAALSSRAVRGVGPAANGSRPSEMPVPEELDTQGGG
jgi:MFS family permease